MTSSLGGWLADEVVHERISIVGVHVMSRAFPVLSLMMVLGAVSGLQAQNLPPSNPQNRLRPIPEDRMTPALEQARRPGQFAPWPRTISIC